MTASKKVYSFDVFDTLLTRCYAKPSDLFHSIAKELRDKKLIQISVDEWVRCRKLAEQEARKLSDSEEITLKEIYDNFFDSMKMQESHKNAMIEIEIQKEIESISCIRYHSEIVNNLRKEGNKVIFISDMYLPKSVIKKALQKNGIDCTDDELFVSSEYKFTKHTGNLFKQVLTELEVAPENMIHTGDNIISDFKIPQSLGIEAVHFSKFNLSKRERLILNDKRLPYNFKSIIASCTRLTTLNNYYDDFHKDQIAKISSSVIAPVLFGFVFWTLVEAKKKGLNKLYFISRDGQILLKIANEINRIRKTGIECVYFYGSRQALHLPAIQPEDLRDLDWLYADTTFLSIELLLGRVDIRPEQLDECLTQSGFIKDSWTYNLNKSERIKIRQTLNESIEFQQLVLSKAKEARITLIDYLKQEGISSDSKMAFVDIGWNGRLQRSLSKVLQMAEIRSENGVTGFYFGLVQRLKAYDSDTLFAYYYDEANGLLPYNDVSLLEKFVEATHGSVLKYKGENDQIVPILKEKGNTNAIEWGLEIQQSAIVDFSRNLSKNLKNIEQENLYNYANWRNLAEALLKDFCLNPSVDESKVFGSITFSEGQNDNTYRKLAKPVSLKNCLTILNNGTHDSYNGLWISGSLMLTKRGRFFKTLMDIKREAARLLKRNKNL